MSRFSIGSGAARRRLVLSASTLALAVVASHPALADDAPIATAPADSATSVSELVVTARKSEGVIAEKRKAAAETVAISAEEIERRPVSNVVDAVSILPGVSVFADNGLGQAATGEPEYVTINGIASNYNAYELNGVRVPAADPSTRALSLKLLPPFGLQSIDVVKTPTADYDGDSIGGVLDIKTPSAFDYSGPLTRITAEGQLNDLAQNSGFGGLGGAVQGEIARRFMGDRLGVYATIFYKQENSITEAGEVASYAPTYKADANLPYSGISLSPTQYKWDLQQNHITTTGGAIGVDYHADNTKLYLRGTAVSYEDLSSDSQVNIRSTGSEYAVQNADGSYAASTAGNAVWTALNPFEGHYFQLRDQVDALYTVQAGGESIFDKLDLTYEASYGYASLTQPNYVQGSLYGAAQTGGTYRINLNQLQPAYNFGVQSGSGLTAAAVESGALNQENNAIWKYQGQDSGSDAQQFGVKVDADYRIGAGFLKSVKVGMNLNSSDRTVWDHYFVAGNNNIYVLSPSGLPTNYNNPQGPTTNNVPGRNVASFFGFPGIASIDQFRAFQRGVFITPVLADKYKTVNCPPDVVDGRTCPGQYTINDYNAGAAYNTENIYAGYIEADLKFGALDLYPGLRYEYTAFHGKSWLDETATTGQYESLGHDYGDVLPSLNAVYRADDGLVYRASIRQGFSRPAFGEMIPNGGFSVVEPSGGQPGQVIINQGNPNLKPTESTNYDVSVEYYGIKDSVFELAGYYKSLSDFIYTASTTGGGATSGGSVQGSLPAGITVPAGYQVIVNEPENGTTGFIEGLTANAQQRLGFLPGFASGFGYRANLTVQHSGAKLGGPLPQSPDILYNLELTFDKYNIHGDLAYQYTGLQLVNNGNGNDGNIPQYLQPTKFLNFALGYQFHKLNISFQAKNLLDGPTFWKTVGKSTQYLGVQDGGGNGSYINFGRTFNIIASYSF